jgi:hypothetical protein
MKRLVKQGLNAMKTTEDGPTVECGKQNRERIPGMGCATCPGQCEKIIPIGWLVSQLKEQNELLKSSQIRVTIIKNNVEDIATQLENLEKEANK